MFPLSFAQRQVWFVEHINGPSAMYNQPIALSLLGSVDVPAMSAAIEDVVSRHASLRTIFPETDGEPCQHILSVSDGVPELRLAETSSDEVQDLAVAAASEPFDIVRQVPLRTVLFRISEDRHVLLLVVHHIAADGWSIQLVVSDLAAAYSARARAGIRPRWDELPIEYSDYTMWQQELLGDPDDSRSIYARGAQFWRDALADVPDALALPSVRQRPAKTSNVGGAVQLRWSSARHAQVLALARAHACTPFMVIQAIVAVLLNRLGGGTDIPQATVVAGRTDEAMERIVGLFVNTLVLRTDLSGNPNFSEVMHRVRETDLLAYAHQELPFDLVVRALNPRRSRAHRPLAQVMVVLENYARSELTFDSLLAEPIDVEVPAAKYELTFQLADHYGANNAPMGIDGYVEYSADLFDSSSVEALIERLTRILDLVAEDSSTPIGSLDVLDANERQLVTKTWNDTSRELPFTSIIEGIRRQAAQTPDGIALEWGSQNISYRDLDERASNLAAHLAEAGVSPGGIVAVALDRTPGLIIAILAALKTGAAYLPLDPNHPAHRLEEMVESAGPQGIVTDRHNKERLDNGKRRLILVESSTLATREERNQASGHNNTVTRHHPAYVMFTSGSTGKPKGVVISHGAIHNRLQWMQATYPLNVKDRVLHKAATTFDVSVWEILWPLLVGSTLVLAESEAHFDPAEIARAISEGQISVAHFVPSMLSLFLAEPATRECVNLRRVFCSGEALSRELARNFFATFPGVSLENLYGPTEAAIDVTAHACDRDSSEAVPIGKPVWNTRTYVLDRMLQPCAVGVAGELYLAGIQLADGYLGRSSATAHTFVADPYGAPGQRMYRTGDIVRWLPTGELDYIGRRDHQVKIRGQRIELGEVESVLLKYENVENAVVTADLGDRDRGRLVGYVVPRRKPLSLDGLRRHLRMHLPTAMVPSSIVTLDELPVSANGKLDRKALPVSTVDVPISRETWTDQEQRLRLIFCELLELPAVGLDDDFFALGGHSLLAAKLMKRIRSEFDTKLTLSAVFDAPTVSNLAQMIDGGEGRGGSRTGALTWPAADLLVEATLGPEVSLVGSLPYDADQLCKRILLTGATGFLGVFLLKILCDATKADVVCLIRASDDAAALARLKSQLRNYRIELDLSRVIAIAGDLAAPDLGLGRTGFRRLAHEIDAIYHNASRVNHLDPYERLRAANVAGTHEIFRLATSQRVKPVHYVSSCDVAIGAERASGEILEGQLTEADTVFTNGYVASKWVAEVMANNALRLGVPVAVYRPSRISGDTSTGVCSTSDSLWSLIRAMLLLSAAPAARSLPVNLVPVDYVASSMVHLSLRPDSVGRTFHLTNPRNVSIGQVVDRLRKRGYRLDDLSPEDWHARLSDLVDDVSGSESELLWFSLAHSEVGFDHTFPEFSRVHTEAGLANFNITTVVVDEDLIDRYIDFFIDSGFFPPAA